MEPLYKEIIEVIEEVDEKDAPGGRSNLSIIDRRSELSQELIDEKPGILERWALLFFAGVFVLLLAGAWFIRYPDIIEVRAKLTAVNAPKEIICRQEGRLVKLFAKNNDQVKEGQIIGLIGSIADSQEMLQLSIRLDSSLRLFDAGLYQQALHTCMTRYFNLGEIQREYGQFIGAALLFNDYILNGFFDTKEHTLQKDILALERTRASLFSQKALTEQLVEIAEENYKVKDALAKDRVLSKEEYRQEYSNYLNKQMSVPQLQISMLTAEMSVRSKQGELEQLRHDRRQQLVVFRQALLALKGNLDDWKRRYLIQAPVTGTVVFTLPVQENQVLDAGKVLGFVKPADSRIYFEANLSQHNFGKLDTGLAVQLRLEAYPYQESGYVPGRLSYISQVPSDSGFPATIQTDSRMITSNRRQIPYRNGLMANAVIITKDMRLLERLYQNALKSTSVGNK